jgi:hypothetical protein
MPATLGPAMLTCRQCNNGKRSSKQQATAAAANLVL